MDENATITLGYYVEKPVVSQEECDKYAAMAQAVNEHNWSCKVGDMTWSIEDKPDRYEVVEGGVVPEPGEPEPTLEEQLAALESSNNDIILMMADLIGGSKE